MKGVEGSASEVENSPGEDGPANLATCNGGAGGDRTTRAGNGEARNGGGGDYRTSRAREQESSVAGLRWAGCRPVKLARSISFRVSRFDLKMDGSDDGLRTHVREATISFSRMETGDESRRGAVAV